MLHHTSLLGKVRSKWSLFLEQLLVEEDEKEEEEQPLAVELLVEEREDHEQEEEENQCGSATAVDARSRKQRPGSATAVVGCGRPSSRQIAMFSPLACP